MKLKPVNDYIIIQSSPQEEISNSGIIIPDTVDQERPERGKVLSVGSGRLLENGQRMVMDVKEGDEVVFKKYAPDEIKIEGENYLVISMNDVIAVIE